MRRIEKERRGMERIYEGGRLRGVMRVERGRGEVGKREGGRVGDGVEEWGGEEGGSVVLGGVVVEMVEGVESEMVGEGVSEERGGWVGWWGVRVEEMEKEMEGV